MKFIKMLGLAAVAAAAVMAFVGASSAMAAETTLCKVSELPCKVENRYPTGTVVSAVSTDATLTTSLGTVTCEKSLVQDKSLAVTGEPLPDEVTSLTWTNCVRNGTESCTVSSVNLPYKTALSWTKEWSGTLTVSEKKGAPGATVVCGFFINCTFTKTPLSLTANGGWSLASEKTPVGEVVANEVELNRSGGLCPSTSTWTAHYKLESPEQLWVEHT